MLWHSSYGFPRIRPIEPLSILAHVPMRSSIRVTRSSFQRCSPSPLRGRDVFSLARPRGVPALAAIVLLCFLASLVVCEDPVRVLKYLAVSAAAVGYAVLVAKRPEWSFVLFLIVASDFLGTVPFQRLPTIRLGFGSVSLMDILVLYPFLLSEANIIRGRKQRKDSVFRRPILFLFFMLAIALLNSVVFQDVPYRNAIRAARPYLNYLYFFILIDSIRDGATFRRVLKLTAAVVLTGCILQIGQYLMGLAKDDLLAAARYFMQHMDNPAIMIINVDGRPVVRYLTRTGNFAVLLFFVSLFSVLASSTVKGRLKAWSSVLLVGMSVALTYGRSLMFLVIVGLAAGFFIEKDQRKRYSKTLLLIASLVLAAALVLKTSSSNNEASLLLSLLKRLASTAQEMAGFEGTFGERLLILKTVSPAGLRGLPFGAGLGVGNVWDIGFLCFFLHFGILGLLFYVWIQKIAVTRFVGLYREQVSPEARVLLKGVACYSIGQLAVLPIQDPFPHPLGILLIVFVLATLECVGYLGYYKESKEMSGESPATFHVDVSASPRAIAAV